MSVKERKAGSTLVPRLGTNLRAWLMHLLSNGFLNYERALVWS